MEIFFITEVAILQEKNLICLLYLSFVTRKPVFGVRDQLRFKLACAATEAMQRLEISNIETRGIIPSKQRITKALI